jgi:hypothetical protein
MRIKVTLRTDGSQRSPKTRRGELSNNTHNVEKEKVLDTTKIGVSYHSPHTNQVPFPPIEHDASLSQADNYENNGDNYSFNQTIFKSALAYCDGINATSIPVIRLLLRRSECCSLIENGEVAYLIGIIGSWQKRRGVQSSFIHRSGLSFLMERLPFIFL